VITLGEVIEDLFRLVGMRSWSVICWRPRWVHFASLACTSRYFQGLLQNAVSCRGLPLVPRENLIVAFRYRPVDRDQQLLLPRDMREWLPESHLVRFVV
jgi:hypothetical protein